MTHGSGALVFERVVKVFRAGRPGPLGAAAGRRRAVDEVSFTVRPGETYGLVGESGCGKTTLARTALALLRPTSGRVFFDGVDVHRMDAHRTRAFRRRVQVVFQDPGGALDPRQRVGAAVEEPLIVHGVGPPARRRARVARLLETVGLRPAEARRFPHQLSGGQKQRVLIARALALGPSLVVLDEPVSALDVSVRAQILNLLADIKAEQGLGYLLISHDIGVVRHVADRVGVMHAGRLVEEGPADVVLGRPAHPYTLALLGAAPVPDPSRRATPPESPPAEPGEAGGDRGRGRRECLYAPLCPRAGVACRRRRPAVRPVDKAGRHMAACHHAPAG